MVGEQIFAWIDSIWGKRGQIQSANQTMPAFTAIESLETYYSRLPPDVQNDPTVKALYMQRQVELAEIHAGIENPLRPAGGQSRSVGRPRARQRSELQADVQPGRQARCRGRRIPGRG